jgi:hypothetical protein
LKPRLIYVDDISSLCFPTIRVYIYPSNAESSFPNTLPKELNKVTPKTITSPRLSSLQLRLCSFILHHPPPPPSLTFSLHSPTQTTSPPLLLHKRPTLQAIPAQPPPRRFKRSSHLTPQTKLWWRLGQTRHRSAHVRGSETPVLRYGLWRLF